MKIPVDFKPCENINYNFTNAFDDFRRNEKSIILVVYIIIGVLAVGGNSLIILLILLTKSLRTVTNILIVNQSISDVLMACITIPYFYLNVVSSVYWKAGKLLCKIGTASLSVSILLSAFNMVALSCDRFRAVIYPLSRKPTKNFILLLCLAIWTAAILLCLPILIYSRTHVRLTNDSDIGYCVCTIFWSNDTQLRVYSPIIQLLEYFIPIIILSITYGKVCREIWGRNIPGESQNGRDKKMVLGQKKSVKMLVAIVVLFALCWLFWNICKFMEIADLLELMSERNFARVRVAAHIIAMSNLCYNPLVYFTMNSKFREAFVGLFVPACDPLKVCKRRASSHEFTGETGVTNC